MYRQQLYSIGWQPKGNQAGRQADRQTDNPFISFPFGFHCKQAGREGFAKEGKKAEKKEKLRKKERKQAFNSFLPSDRDQTLKP